MNKIRLLGITIFFFFFYFCRLSSQDCATWTEGCFNGGYRWVVELEPGASINFGAMTPASDWTITQTGTNQWTILGVDSSPGDLLSFAQGSWSVSGTGCNVTNFSVEVDCLIDNCPNCNNPPCTLTATSPSNLVCNDNGTPNNTLDDTFTFDIEVNQTSGSGVSWLADDPLNSSGTFSSVVNMGPYLIADGSFSFTITNNSDTNCTTTVNVNPPTPCSNPTSCVLSVSNTNTGPCNNNGTTNDASDDFFEYSFTVNISSGIGTQYNVDNGLSILGPFNYGVPNSITLPANGNIINIDIIDVADANCTTTINASQNSCSSSLVDCATWTEGCFNGGYQWVITVETGTNLNFGALNPSASWVVNQTAANEWTIFVSDPDPADISNLAVGSWDITGTSCNTIFFNESFDCLIENCPNCSAADCTISALEPVILNCDDNGTPSILTDDTYEVQVNASVMNGGLSNQFTVFNGITTLGPFSYDIGGTFILPAGGTIFTLTYQDVDNPTCEATNMVSQGPCLNSCTMSVDELTFISCSDNMTPIEPLDDILTYNFNLSITDCSSTNFNILDSNGNIYGPFLYNVIQTVEIPAFGGNITLNFIDNTCNCNISQVVNGDPCSNQCSIIVTQSSSQPCDDNGTPSDPSDDTYQVLVNAENLNPNVGTEFIVTDGNLIFGPFNYFIGGVITLPADGANVDLFYIDVDDSNCLDFITVSMLDCSNVCLLTIEEVSIVSCDDNGTNSNSTDDTFDVFVNASALNPSNSDEFFVSFGSTDFGPFIYGTGGTITLPANGDLHDLTFTDLDDAMCNDVAQISMLPCSTPCDLSIDETTLSLCDDNNTPTDPSDDTYTVTVNASALNGGINNQFQVIANMLTFGPFEYGTGGVVLLPADGLNYTLTFFDFDDSACSNIANVSLASCSDQCLFSIDNAASSVCNDNGTPSDATDDTFDVSVNASAVNPGANNQFQVNDGTNIYGPFNYGTGGNITLPANGMDISLTYSDIDDLTCFDQVIVNVNSCSNACAIMITDETPSACDNNGTLIDPTDDTYTVSVNATAINNGVSNQFNISDGTNTYGPFDYGIGGMITLPSNGLNIILTFSDVDDPTCSAMTTVISFPCSTTCILTIDNATISPCMDNNTNMDPSDDFYTVNVNASVVNGGISNQFIVNDGTNTSGPFLYGTGGVVTLPADGLNYILTFIDVDDNACNNVITVSQNSCSDACAFSITDSSISPCDDNGTNQDGSDDFYTLSVNATAINGGISNLFTINDGINSYGPFTYNVGGTLTLPADGFNYNLTYSDVDNPNCNDQVTVSQFACSGFCPNPISDVQFHINQPNCPSDNFGEIVIDTIIGGAGIYEYSFDQENYYPNDSVGSLYEGNYDFYVLDSTGCEYQINFDIEAPFEFTIDLGPDTTINLGETVELFINSNINLSQVEWTWNDTTTLSCLDCINPETTPGSSVQYIIEAISPDSCFVSDTLNIFVIQDYKIYIPNVFSPNEDGYNDFFSVYPSRGIEEIMKIEVYSRWGSKVYEQGPYLPSASNAIEIGWDGTFNGKKMNSAVYVYRVEARLTNGEIIQLSGDITLIL